MDIPIPVPVFKMATAAIPDIDIAILIFWIVLSAVAYKIMRILNDDDPRSIDMVAGFVAWIIIIPGGLAQIRTNLRQKRIKINELKEEIVRLEKRRAHRRVK